MDDDRVDYISKFLSSLPCEFDVEIRGYDCGSENKFKRIPKKKKKDKWQDALSEDSLATAASHKLVLVCNLYGEMFVASREDGMWLLHGDTATRLGSIVYWRPLPKLKSGLTIKKDM
jgi:hypothetical protein